MKRKKRLFGGALAAVCILCIALLVLVDRMIDRGEAIPVMNDESIWNILHVYKGTYNDETLPQFVFTKKLNAGLAMDVQGYFVDDIVYCIFPQGTDVSGLRLSYTSDEPLFTGGRRVVSGVTRLDLSQPLSMECGGKTYQLEVRFTELPVLELCTTDGEYPVPNGRTKAVVFNLYDASGHLLVNDTGGARVRGNMTATLSKLPLRLESSHSHALLGLPEDDTWALLANFLDPTLMRNQVAFDLARALGMKYVPQQQYVDLYMNGKYQGVYAATTQLGIRSGSIDLPPVGADAPDGSYLLEFDRRSRDDPQTITTPLGVPIVIHSPSSVSDTVRERITGEVLRLEAAITAPDGVLDGVRYTELIDLDSLADIFLVNELAYNGDARDPLSIFMYKDTDGKFYMGPVWDFDISFGLYPLAADVNPPVLMLSDSWWWPYLLQDGEFRQVLADKMILLEDWCAQEDVRITQLAQQLERAEVNNYIVSYLGVNDYSNTLEDDLFAEEVANLRAWLPRRYAELSDALPAP